MNKLWNSARFIIMNIDEDLNDFITKPKTKDLDATAYKFVVTSANKKFDQIIPVSSLIILKT